MIGGVEAANVVLAIIAGNVATMWMVVKVIRGRIDELVAPMDRADATHAAMMESFARFG
jgi:hypothetical protein